MLASGIKLLEEKYRGFVGFVQADCVNLPYDATSVIVDLKAPASLQSFTSRLQHPPVSLAMNFDRGDWAATSVHIRNDEKQGIGLYSA